MSCTAHHQSLCKDLRDISPTMKENDSLSHVESIESAEGRRGQERIEGNHIEKRKRNIHPIVVMMDGEWYSRHHDDERRLEKADSDEMKR